MLTSGVIQNKKCKKIQVHLTCDENLISESTTPQAKSNVTPERKECTEETTNYESDFVYALIASWKSPLWKNVFPLSLSLALGMRRVVEKVNSNG